MTDEHDEFRPSRRIVFNGLAALGVAAALAGCGSGNNKAGSPSAAGSGAKGGTELARTSEVPVGGGLILPDQKIVITQPTSGSFKAFSAVCTHQGFTVTSVEGGHIKCNHHGSQYSAKTGAVEHGPASAPLSAVAVKVKDGMIVAT
ncbi:MAG: Rieske (2Fe-2S) protein [Actinomycetota bacterium]|nr:Rieske (2Fe-2S) protein [Actinomycetota bacterium]